MNEQVAAIIEDLRRFSPDLTDPGTRHPVRFASGLRGLGSLGATLARVIAFARLVPSLMAESVSGEGSDPPSWRSTHIPVRATLPRDPWQYEQSDGRWLPRAWVVPEVALVPDRASARWIEHLIAIQFDRLNVHRTRVAKHSEDMRATAMATAWGRVEIEALVRLLARIDDARGTLARASFFVSQAMSGRVTPCATPPSPYPRTPPWVTMREFAEAILDPRREIRAGLHALLAGDVETADEPYLYQRWVGLKLFTAFGDLGWTHRGDLVGALFLGGDITFEHGDSRIVVYVEPRILDRPSHASGCYCTRGTEVTPDYMIVAPGPSGYEVYVLDASKTTNRDVLREKCRYLELIAHVRPRRVAGVWTRHPPRRAWAAAPIARDVCDLDRPDGSAGIVPMLPTPFSKEPIAAWVGDIDREARAWSGWSREGAPVNG